MKKQFLSGLIWIISLLPFWVLYRISDFFYVVIYYIIGYRKPVVLKNLANAFPEKSAQEIKTIAQKFYRYLPDIFVEAIKMRTLSKKEVIKRVEFLNFEELERHFLSGKSVTGITAHYCNWELCIHRMSLMTQNPQLIIYKPLNNKDFDAVFNQIRTRFGATMVPMKQILRHIVKLKNQIHLSVFAADQTPVYQDSDYFIQFLNQETLVYTGAERIAKMTGNPVVYCHMGRKKQRGHYYCKFTTLVENPKSCEEHEITQIHNKFTEQMIREQPQYWLWSHNRWKRKKRI